jgi:uncharacterized iron-regulated membrane protein
MNSWVLRWHRRLGLVAALVMILSSLSGMLHPLMTRLQPAPAKVSLDQRLPPLDDAMEPRRLLTFHGLSALSDLRVVSWAGSAYYQATLPDGFTRQYFDLKDGRILPDGDRRYAEYLAREFVGEPTAAVRAAAIVKDFDWEYPRINRLLPVWRVGFDRIDAMRVYVDTRTGRLGTLVDRAKAFSSIEFAILHRWQWLEVISPVGRVIALSLALAAAAAVTLSGIWIYLARWSQTAKRWNLRRVHRVWGISISLFSFIFVLSGGYHLVYMAVRGDAGERLQPAMKPHRVADLDISPAEAAKQSGFDAIESISLAQIDGRTYYRVQPAVSDATKGGAHQHGGHVPHGKVTPGQVTAPPTPVFVSAVDRVVLTDGLSRFATEIAQAAVGAPAAGAVAVVTEFDREYGFTFKRLPVLRLWFADNVTVYVDPADGAIAAIVDAGDRAEGWIFGNIHKFDWLVRFIGTDGRDAVATLLAMGVAIAAVLGITLYWKLARAGRRIIPDLDRQ